MSCIRWRSSMATPPEEIFLGFGSLERSVTCAVEFVPTGSRSALK